jgi:hypothetical protein
MNQRLARAGEVEKKEGKRRIEKEKKKKGERKRIKREVKF